MICKWVSNWLFYRSIKPLVVPLPISLWPIACVFSELVGESYLMLLSGRCFMGTVGSSTGFLFSIRCKNSYILGYQIAAHC